MMNVFKRVEENLINVLCIAPEMLMLNPIVIEHETNR